MSSSSSKENFTALRLSAVAVATASGVVGFYASSALYGNALATRLADAIVMRIGDADARWNLFRVLDDDATPANAKLIIAASSCLAQFPTYAGVFIFGVVPFCVPWVRRTVKRRFVEPVFERSGLAQHLSRVRKCLLQPESRNETSGAGGPTVKELISLLVVGSLTGAAVWHTFVFFGSHLRRELFMPVARDIVWRALAPATALKTPEAPLALLLGSAALYAATAFVPMAP